MGAGAKARAAAGAAAPGAGARAEELAAGAGLHRSWGGRRGGGGERFEKMCKITL